eukprot:CAMPEP_0115830092 /NCGR_PEP_ID=MMETSP0287-20121206/1439_1 /TAXON_ID=412157 /ORGANISM="Chrysochromulina rotalis, Strain UIO044" /LENGTH=100 /DNA_ID=CAMNT_0003283385 /DNA_START=346 /DNA_END=645 /DNA_ORIENTATION=-
MHGSVGNRRASRLTCDFEPSGANALDIFSTRRAMEDPHLLLVALSGKLGLELLVGGLSRLALIHIDLPRLPRRRTKEAHVLPRGKVELEQLLGVSRAKFT